MQEFIKQLKDIVPWIIGLSFWPKLLVSILIVVVALLLLVLIWSPENKNNEKNKVLLSKNGIEIQLSEHWLNMSSRSEMVKTRGDTAIYTEPDWRITSFYLEGENNRNNKIEKIKGYIESTEFKKRINIKIDSYNPEDIHGIPASANFKINAIFPRSTTDREGLTFEEFWREFGAFDLYLDFDGVILTKHFSHNEIQEYIDNYIASLPERGTGRPRVERK